MITELLAFADKHPMWTFFYLVVIFGSLATGFSSAVNAIARRGRD